jgi:tetratricopeptide (TPR) repeat protein
MKRMIVSLVLGVALLLAANKAVDEAKALMKDKKYEEAVAVLEPALKASPNDASVKKTMVEALMGNGDAYMYNEKLPPFRKYPAALKSYRRVLEFDKNNQKAKDNIAMIEGIYKSMGRPVPQ